MLSYKESELLEITNVVTMAWLVLIGEHYHWLVKNPASRLPWVLLCSTFSTLLVLCPTSSYLALTP